MYSIELMKQTAHDMRGVSKIMHECTNIIRDMRVMYKLRNQFNISGKFIVNIIQDSLMFAIKVQALIELCCEECYSIF